TPDRRRFGTEALLLEGWHRQSRFPLDVSRFRVDRRLPRGCPCRVDDEDLVAGDERELDDGEQEERQQRQDEGELGRRLTGLAPVRLTARQPVSARRRRSHARSAG